MRDAGSPSLVRRLAGLSASIVAITDVVENVVGLLRQLVQVAGWLILLVGCVELFFHPHLSITYLAPPGGGALAVLQGLLRRRARPVTAVPASEKTDVMSELLGESAHLPSNDA